MAKRPNGTTEFSEPQYLVVRRFTGGLLAGLTYSDWMRFPPVVGFRCDRPIGGSPYVVERVTLLTR